jgi:glycosyltransferase involved in cell wall biosynthesis
MKRLALFANTDWYLFNHRLSLAKAARELGVAVYLVSPPGPYVQKLTDEGFIWCELPIERRGTNLWRELITVQRVAWLYRRISPDLAHHFTVKPVFYGSLAARWTNVPAVVNSITGMGYLFTSQSPRMTVLRALLKPFYTFAMNHPSQRTIFQHEGDRQRYIKLGIAHPKTSVIIPSSGVDLERFAPREEPKGRPTVLMAARMLWDKGVGDLVDASRQLEKQGDSARIWLVGKPDPGNPSAITESLLKKWHEEGVVEWLGHRDDMPAVYAQSHIVVLPSYAEGVPKGLIEAAAMGKPIVATDLPGCREAVEHGRNGFLVPPGDARALQDALAKLLHSAQMRENMGRESRRIAEERFSDKLINKHTLAVYQSLQKDFFEQDREGL